MSKITDSMLVQPQFQVSLFDQVIAQYRDCYYPDELIKGKMNLNLLACDCLRLAMAAMDVLGAMKVNCRLAAGSAKWLVNTGFEYEYRYTPAAHDLNSIMAGNLPEIHCWVVAGDRQSIIVDAPPVLFPEAMQVNHKEHWAGIRPTIAREFHRRIMVDDEVKLFRACYVPCRHATELAKNISKLCNRNRSKAGS